MFKTKQKKRKLELRKLSEELGVTIELDYEIDKAYNYIIENVDLLRDIIDSFPKFKNKGLVIKFKDTEKRPIAYKHQRQPLESGETTIGTGNLQKSIEIELAGISSLIHEFGHLVDEYEIKNRNSLYSETSDYALINHLYKETLSKELKASNTQLTHDLKRYSELNVETFARLFQQYYLDLYGENELTRMKKPLDIADETARKVYQEHKELIDNYFDEVYYNVQFEPNLLDLNEQLGRSL